MKRLLYTLLLALSCSLTVGAEEHSTDQQHDRPAATAATGEQQPATAAVTPEPKVQTPESFTPSEEISEDLSVAFPVDI